MKYLLKKDLPGVKAGTEIECYGDQLTYYIGGDDKTVVNKTFAESNPDFFEPIPETPKKPKTVWDLKDGDVFFFINMYRVDDGIWRGTYGQESWRESLLMFMTKEDAERELAYRKAKTAILKHHAENSGFVPDWSDKTQNKWYAIYDLQEKEVTYDSVNYRFIGSEFVYFESKKTLQQSIKDCEKEWKVIFNVK